MKKILLFAASICIGLSNQGYAQTAADTLLSQNFESTAVGSLPTGWTTTGTVGWVTNIGAPILANWTIPSHTNYAIVNDYGLGNINNVAALTSPAFRLDTSTNAFLVFDYWFVGAAYNSGNTTPEAAYVNISDDSGKTWTRLFTAPQAAVATVLWTKGTAPLAGHHSANTMIQFVYNDNGLKLIGFAVDNIFVGDLAPTNDIAIQSTGLDNAYYPQNYGSVSAPLSYKGTIVNKGGNPITSFTIYSQIPGNAVESKVIVAPDAVGPYETYTYTSDINLPAGQGSWNTKIWAVISNDTDHTNDSTKVGIGAYNNAPKKRLSFEEGTGTWCGWCIRGIVYMDSLRKLYGEDGPSLIAVHDGDPMAITAYDSYMTGHFYNSFPNVSVDRRELHDPSELLDVQNEESDLFGFADVKVATPVMNGNILSSNVTITPATDLNGDYRLVLVVTQDGVHNEGSTYAQHNYYALVGGVAGAGPMGGWENQASIVPADYMYFDHVARTITPSVTGAAGVLPTAMVAGTAYTATLTATVDTVNDIIPNLRTVVLLIRNSDGIVLNSASTTYWPVNVKTVSAGIDNILIYPNPAQDNATISMKLNQSTNVQISVLDQLGRTVSAVANQNMASGSQTVNINTSNLASGIYNVKIETAKGITTERLSVVR